VRVGEVLNVRVDRNLREAREAIQVLQEAARAMHYGDNAARCVEDYLAEIRPAMMCAEQVLREHLDAKQTSDLNSSGWFEVIGQKSGLRYRILRDVTHNIRREDGRVYCALPSGYLPAFDVMLAQKLMLENDEDTFLSVANCWQYGGVGGWRVG
jgi:hypothetical protein